MVNPGYPEGAASRGLHIGKLAAKLTGSYLGYQIQNAFQSKDDRDDRKRKYQQSASRYIREELQMLKGPVMKLGQALSTQGFMLPEEALKELAALQMHAPAMHPTLARAQFKTSYGKFPEQVFKHFSREPFAAASLGQVHKAVTRDDQEVAIKIQYPAIRASVKSDFKLLRTAVTAGQLSGYLTREMLNEIESIITVETDYVQEADNLNKFHHGLLPLSYVDVPEPFTEFSTDRVLTMSYLEGMHIDAWLACSPSEASRDRLGARLFELFYYQFLVMGALHADPHPGNYLFTKDDEIGLIDLGCVKQIDPKVIEAIPVFVTSTGPRLSEEKVGLISQLIWSDRDQLDGEQARKVIDSVFHFVRLIFPEKNAGHQVVDFGDTAIFDALAGTLKEVIECRLTCPELFFFMRAEMGLYNMLHRLGARVDTRRVYEGVEELGRV